LPKNESDFIRPRDAAAACDSQEHRGETHSISRSVARMCDSCRFGGMRLLSCAEMSDQHVMTALFLLELVIEGVAGLIGAMIWKKGVAYV
jgi:hypothetical protein